jgi:hypothetical protein
MRCSPNRRPTPVSALAAVLPVLLLAPPLAADTFFWNTTAGASSWHASSSWSGPAGQYPRTWTDIAYVNGSTTDPVVRENIVIGSLVIQNGGHVTAGGNDPLSSLVVTSSGGLSGFTLIKHAGSTLTVFPSTNYRDFQSENLKIQVGAALRLRDGATVQLDNQLILQAGGVVEGHGELDFSQTDGTLDPYNDGLIHSRFGTLRFYNSGSSVAVLDLDGPSEDGAVEAWADSTLVIDTGIETEFNGTMVINERAGIEINADWTLAGEAGSVLVFFGGSGDDRAILSGGGATLLGQVLVASGEASLEVPVTLGSTAVLDLAAGATLHGDDSIVIEAGATLGGAGELSVTDGARLELGSGSTAGVTVRNHGVTVVGGVGSGLAIVGGFEQSATGRSEFDLCSSTGEGIVERLVVSGTAVLDGELNLTAVGGCEPSPGDEFTILTAASCTGIFATVTGMPDVEVVYTADSVTVRIPPPCPADLDGSGFIDVGDLLQVLADWGACAGCPADLDGNGAVDVTDLLQLLALWGAC